MAPKYSIIIGVLGHFEDCTKPCLEAIQKYTDMSQVEVIIVANGCKKDDGTKEYVEKLGDPFRLLWFDEPLGYAGANNAGIAVARAEKIILLNNDAFLLEQPKNQWIEMLEAPFKEDPTVGITGPLKGHSDPGGRDFMVFFCVMIKRELIDKLKLNMDYEVGGGEDTEYCYEAEKMGYTTVQVPTKPLEPQPNYFVGGFPVYHAGEATVYDNPEWQRIFLKNSLTLAKKYNHAWYRWKLGNNYERAVIFKEDVMSPNCFESLRYKFAAQNMTGKKVLEFGCSSGFALKFLPEDIDYTGVDYDPVIIETARNEFGAPNHKFVCIDANKFEFKEHYDTIIAYEFIEHIDNGKEFAQKLKQHCDTLIISTPYKERPGFWGHHHRLHNLTPSDFPGFEYKYLVAKESTQDAYMSDTPVETILTLQLMKWERGKEYKIVEKTYKGDILAFVPTRNRYDSLALTIQSIALQTVRPDHLMIYDDGEHRDLRQDSIYKYLFRLLDLSGITWEVVFGNQQGQHYGHEIANLAGYKYVWRIDDDETAEPDVLYELRRHMEMGPDVGAVGGSVIIPGEENRGGTSLIDHIYTQPNIQWSRKNPGGEVDHLYSSFLYRADVAHYDTTLSPVAHREETMFTHSLKQKGFKLYFVPQAVTYHFRQEHGGIRDQVKQDYFTHDEIKFKEFLEKQGIKVIRENGGLGDNLIFKENALQPLLNKHKKVILGTCYTDIYKDLNAPNLIVVPVGAIPEVPNDNIYAWAAQQKWKSSFGEAYKKFYGVE